MVSELQIAQYFRGLDSKGARVKYGCSRALRLAAQQSPSRVYKHFDRLARLLDRDNAILRWNAAWALGYLAAVDAKGKIDRILRRICAPITGKEMVGAANAIGAAAEIALARPELADRIARAILKVEHASYARPECRNVAIGHAIQAFARIRALLTRKRPVIDFVRLQLDNPRPATRRKAERFLGI
jgi:hypothetical protein